jgi:hypothetical protein
MDVRAGLGISDERIHEAISFAHRNYTHLKQVTFTRKLLSLISLVLLRPSLLHRFPANKSHVSLRLLSSTLLYSRYKITVTELCGESAAAQYSIVDCFDDVFACSLFYDNSNELVTILARYFKRRYLVHHMGWKDHCEGGGSDGDEGGSDDGGNEESFLSSNTLGGFEYHSHSTTSLYTCQQQRLRGTALLNTNACNIYTPMIHHPTKNNRRYSHRYRRGRAIHRHHELPPKHGLDA